MELYQERGINPFGSIGVALLQLPILIGLYIGLQKVIKDPNQIVDFAYPALQHLHWMEQLASNIKQFDSSLFHVVDLSRAAIGPQGLYIPALIIVLASAVTQYFQAKQLMPVDKDARSLRTILREAGAGKQADQSEVSAAIGQSTKYFLPVLIFVFTINIPSALGLYWFVGGLVAFLQQSYVLRGDNDEMDQLAVAKKTDRDTTRIPEAEVITEAKTTSSISQTPVIDTAPLLPTQLSKKALKKQAATAGSFTPKAGSTVTSITRSKKGKK